MWMTIFIHLLYYNVIFCLQSSFNSPHARYKRMVLGRKALISEWPFATWLVMKGSSSYEFCGGALIRKDWVLTAAHCVVAIKDTPWIATIRIGSVKRRRMDRIKSFQYNISKIYINPTFKNELVPINDIALLKLARPVETNRYTSVRPIRIALWRITDQERKDYVCKAAGWGKYKIFKSLNELKNKENTPSKRLKEINVPILSIKQCYSSMTNSTDDSLIKYKKKFNDTMICGGGLKSYTGTACLHDSGSPLLCKNKYNEKALHGITIAIHGPNIETKPCNPATQVMVFVRVSRFARWILKIVDGS